MRLIKRLINYLAVEPRQAGIIAVMALLQILFLFLVHEKGKGMVFLPLMLVILPASCLALYMGMRLKMNIGVLIPVIILVNFGMAVQLISTAVEKLKLINLWELDKKLLAVIFVAVGFAWFFEYFSSVISTDHALVVMCLIQITIYVLMAAIGKRSGVDDIQGAVLTINGITPLEFVKLIYVFIMAGLMTEDEKIGKRFFNMINREVLALCYTILTILPIAAFRDYGCVLIIGITGAALFLIFGSNRHVVRISAMIGFLLLCLLIIMIGVAGGPFYKINLRLKQLQNPLLSKQSLRIRSAIAIGGLFGPETNRYLIRIPLQASDAAFAKLIGCFGFVSGCVVVLLYLVLLAMSFKIAWDAKDTYYRGISMGISLLMMSQSLIHVGYCVGAFPITGINLFFISSGASSLLTGFVAVATLMVISRGNQWRNLYFEEDIGWYWKHKEMVLRRNLCLGRAFRR